MFRTEHNTNRIKKTILPLVLLLVLLPLFLLHYVKLAASSTRLAVTHPFENRLSLFVYTNNRLTLADHTSLDRVAGIAVHPDGNIFVATTIGSKNKAGTANVYKMHASNRLRCVYTFPLSGKAMQTHFSPSGRLLFTLGNGKLSIYRMQSLSRFICTVEQKEIDAYFMAFHPTEKLVFFSGNTLRSARYKESGQLSIIETRSNYNGALGIALDSSGKYLYVADTDRDKIDHYAVSPKGKLKLLGSHTQKKPFSLVSHPDQPFLFASDYQEGHIRSYRILQNGGLWEINRLQLSPQTLLLPGWRNTLLYGCESTSNALAIMSIDSQGRLTPRQRLMLEERPVFMGIVPGKKQ